MNAQPHKKPSAPAWTSTIEPAPWATSPGMYISGRASIDEADATAVDCETRWGIGRLRMLVGVDLREKFDRQRYKFNQALWHGQLSDVQREAARMCAAWRALDRAATEMGAVGPSMEVWEARAKDGTVLVFARDNMSARAALADGRSTQVWTLDEIANVLAAVPSLARVKGVFPGAKVEAGRPYPDDPLDSIRDSQGGLDDEIPF